ncbi:hypothetical protein [Sphingobium sp. HDIP04]|uniref:hypothetical protein n=1 Tax=Sphingobium sp. HDIP04 TaxID=428994 RepID=UPI0003875FA4|nr:hypothetical protein [Sphingobium sp. HDIP04]EQA97281.1 hypothetical protein L286_23435 [Sphingobium sp. HDIP04]
MPAPDLESLTPGLFSAVDAMLGDTISVVPPNGAPMTIKAHVSHRDKTRVLDFSAATAQDILIDLGKELVPGKPIATWRIALPRLPGRVFSPKEVNTDDSGFRWEFGLREEPNG